MGTTRPHHNLPCCDLSAQPSLLEVSCGPAQKKGRSQEAITPETSPGRVPLVNIADVVEGVAIKKVFEMEQTADRRGRRRCVRNLPRRGVIRGPAVVVAV